MLDRRCFGSPPTGPKVEPQTAQCEIPRRKRVLYLRLCLVQIRATGESSQDVTCLEATTCRRRKVSGAGKQQDGKGTSTLMRTTALLTVWLVAGTSNSVSASDFWSEPIFIASISVPLGAIPDNTAASPRFMLTITGRSVQSGDEERQLLELSAPIATPSSLSLNGHPVFRSTGYNTAESTDRN